MAHVGAIRAFAEASGDFDLGIAVFIEGEEEWASRSFANFLRENRDLLAADAIIVADSGNWDLETPAITVALRGAVAFNLRIDTLDARLALRHVRRSRARRDARRHPAARHALDAPTAPSPSTGSAAPTSRRPTTTRRSCAPRPACSTASRRSATARSSRASGRSRRSRSRASTHPDVANASNTLVPGVRVRVSARIAPGQDAVEAFEAIRAHLEAHAPFGARLTFEDVDTGQAFLVDTSGWAVAETRAAMAEGWGREPVEIGVGGSIPFIAELVDEFPDAQILVTGVEDPDSRAHSPNESLHLGVFKRALLSEALFLARLDGTRRRLPEQRPDARSGSGGYHGERLPRSLTHRGET